QRTRDYLDHGAPEGQRNDELFAAAVQFKDAGYTIDEATGHLGPRAGQDGLSESEILSTIRSAYAREPRAHIFGRNGQAPLRGPALAPKVQSNQSAAPDPQPLPKPVADGLRVLLETCFEQGENVAISNTKLNANGEAKPGAGDVYQREAW